MAIIASHNSDISKFRVISPTAVDWSLYCRGSVTELRLRHSSFSDAGPRTDESLAFSGSGHTYSTATALAQSVTSSSIPTSSLHRSLPPHRRSTAPYHRFTMSKKHWVPLESNPEVLTKFSHALGMPSTHVFSDVWSPDPEMLAFVPSPRLAVLCLYPLTPAILAADAARAASAPPPPADAAAPVFCGQKVGNACGTIALLHAVLNAGDGLGELTDGSFFAEFARKTDGMDAGARADALAADDSLDAVHAEFAAQGQTAPPAADDKIDLHFVAFVRVGGVLWELDGRKAAPVSHGECGEEALLQDACKAIKDCFMAADPKELRFTLLALTPDQGGD